MGSAAHRRGSQAIREQLSREQRPEAFRFIEELNALERYPDAGCPLGHSASSMMPPMMCGGSKTPFKAMRVLGFGTRVCEKAASAGISPSWLTTRIPTSTRRDPTPKPRTASTLSIVGSLPSTKKGD